jgi:hypothetical protein
MAAGKSTFDINEDHVYFSREAYNYTWEYMEQADPRSSEEDMNMLHSAIASLWHWSRRDDVMPANLAVGCWQVSRVFNLIQQPANARAYGLLALEYARELDAFFKGYAYETLARAGMLEGDRVGMMNYLEKAHTMVMLIKNEEDQQLLLRDLATIKL